MTAWYAYMPMHESWPADLTLYLKSAIIVLQNVFNRTYVAVYISYQKLIAMGNNMQKDCISYELPAYSHLCIITICCLIRKPCT